MHRVQFHKSMFALRKDLTGLLEGGPVAFNQGLKPYQMSDLSESANPNPRVR
ncbi:MAG: hypothetical protein PHQ40_12360 [Anaerolineaceae bacterium]|nr:hypothetical protein [Anaerolineaceae bacterium]